MDERINRDEMYDEPIKRVPKSQEQYTLSDRLIGNTKYFLHRLNFPVRMMDGIAEISGFNPQNSKQDYIQRAKESRLAREKESKLESDEEMSDRDYERKNPYNQVNPYNQRD